MLDEATSAVSDEVESNLYRTAECIGTTLFTVSHRASLRRHHVYELAIEGGMEGKWSWNKIDQEDLDSAMIK